MFRSKEFQRSVMPLIIANSIVCTGLLEYFINRTIRRIGFIYAICCILYYTTLFFTLKQIMEFFINDQVTEISGIMLKYFYINNIFVYIIIISVSLMRSERMKLFLRQLEICRQGIDELNVSRNYSSLLRYQCIAGVILIFMILGLIIANIFWFSYYNLSLDYTLILQFYYFETYPAVVATIIDFTFLFWVRQLNHNKYVKILFGQLNAVLQNMLTTTIDSPQHKRVLQMKDNWQDDSSLSTIYRTYKANENLKKLKRVKQIHLELIKCAGIINEAYGLQILMSMSSSVFIIILFLYNLYSIGITNKYDNWMKDSCGQIYWIFCFFFKIFAINNICERTMTEKHILISVILLYATNTVDILYELYEPSTSRKFRDEIHDVMYQLVQNRLKFTACGFYDIDHTFIYTIIGSITTFLVILIQLGDKLNNTLKMSLSAELRRNIKPLIIMNSIFITGLLEYFIDDKINKIGMFYAFFSIIFYISITFVSSFLIRDLLNIKSYLLQIIYVLYIYNGYITYVATIIIGILRRKKVRRFTIQVENCIRTMHQLNIPMNLSKYFLQQCYIMLFLVFILIALIIVNYHWLILFEINPWIIFRFFYLQIYPFIVWLITDVTFVFWMGQVESLNIQIKFSQLNELLKNMLTTTIDSPQHKRILWIRNNRKNDSPSSNIHQTDKSNKDVITIKKAKEIHLELIKCARKINDAYGLHILFSILTATILIIITAYNEYYYLLTQSYYVVPLRSFIYLFWISYFAFKIIILCLCKNCNEVLILCHISLHATNTGDILCELYEPSTSNEFRAEIRDFTLQLIQNPLSFTICGFFDLDYTLIRNVIATVITYLVILIQMGNIPSEFIVENSTLITNDSRKI
ncbi:LOW QUALITY PROTEIN: gustatory and pheromone receptor 32a-like [Vespula maculifrons]|uniref:Gustatory and pheromone receptor 32a-like n=1 Tax=Vespula maculifrons TaxID=7453 RepID=A0ABD2CQ23_VESMC